MTRNNQQRLFASSLKDDNGIGGGKISTTTTTMSNNNTEVSSLSIEDLCQKAKDLIKYKNVAGRSGRTDDLENIFHMFSKDANIYGLIGEETYRPGLIKFFKSHKGLQHTLLNEDDDGPITQISSDIVQYPFIKSWQEKKQQGEKDVDDDDNDDDDDKSSSTTTSWVEWKSIDPDKPRNKVERLQFNSDGLIIKISVVDLSSE